MRMLDMLMESSHRRKSISVTVMATSWSKSPKNERVRRIGRSSSEPGQQHYETGLAVREKLSNTVLKHNVT